MTSIICTAYPPHLLRDSVAVQVMRHEWPGGGTVPILVLHMSGTSVEIHGMHNQSDLLRLIEELKKVVPKFQYDSAGEK